MIEILPAAAQAAPLMADLHGQAFDAPWSAAEFTALMTGPGVFALRASVAEHPAGFILCRVAVDEAEVLTLATVPGLRRRGVASALLDQAIAVALSRGAVAMFLEVAADNPGAAALYRTRGFRQVGARPAYYSRHEGAADALIMRLDLNR